MSRRRYTPAEVGAAFQDLIAAGELVPVFDSDGIPKTKDGWQVYRRRDRQEKLEELAAATAEWLERNTASDHQAAAEYLCSAHPNLLPSEVDYVVREAAKIRRGVSAP